MKRISFVAMASLLLWSTAQLGALAHEPGTAAPAFRLQDQNDQWVSLADQKGHWLVLYFYPKDDTPGCTTEACEFRDNLFAFKKLGATVLGVSVQDVASKKAFSEKNSLPFSLLADIDQSVSKAYGVLDANRGVANRQSFIINPKGQIMKHFATVNPKAHSAEVLAELQTLGAH
jgi:peroxiredoxin Q/BCP